MMRRYTLTVTMMSGEDLGDVQEFIDDLPAAIDDLARQIYDIETTTVYVQCNISKERLQ